MSIELHSCRVSVLFELLQKANGEVEFILIIRRGFPVQRARYSQNSRRREEVPHVGVVEYVEFTIYPRLQ